MELSLARPPTKYRPKLTFNFQGRHIICAHRPTAECLHPRCWLAIVLCDNRAVATCACVFVELVRMCSESGTRLCEQCAYPQTRGQWCVIIGKGISVRVRVRVTCRAQVYIVYIAYIGTKLMSQRNGLITLHKSVKRRLSPIFQCLK